MPAESEGEGRFELSKDTAIFSKHDAKAEYACANIELLCLECGFFPSVTELMREVVYGRRVFGEERVVFSGTVIAYSGSTDEE